MQVQCHIIHSPLTTNADVAPSKITRSRFRWQMGLWQSECLYASSELNGATDRHPLPCTASTLWRKHSIRDARLMHVQLVGMQSAHPFSHWEKSAPSTHMQPQSLLDPPGWHQESPACFFKLVTVSLGSSSTTAPNIKWQGWTELGTFRSLGHWKQSILTRWYNARHQSLHAVILSIQLHKLMFVLGLMQLVRSARELWSWT